MKVVFESRDPGAAELRELAEHRTSVVMRRLTWLVPSAKVQMSDVNGPRGGVDKRCKVELQTEGAGTIIVTSLARDWRSALDAALLRAARALVRLWRRGHQHRPGRAQHAGSGIGAGPRRALAWNAKER
jgi:ribosome-associated translation inhibitor RaiA